MKQPYLGMLLHALHRRVDVKLAEMLAEMLERRHVDRLVAEEDDAVVQERLVDVFDLAVGDRLHQVEAGNLAADMRREPLDLDRVVTHRRPPAVRPVAGRLYADLSLPQTARQRLRETGQDRHVDRPGIALSADGLDRALDGVER